jgi:NosR/NirI family transcriptional regulator, nitrous oxide reductase regulator
MKISSKNIIFGCRFKATTLKLLILPILFFFASELFSQQQRFPQPEFHTEYQMPEKVEPAPRSGTMEYIDLLILISVLALSTFIIFKKRSRKWIIWISFFTLIYFGFYRNGCICSIGALQNVGLSLFADFYTVPLTVLAFFAIPMILALFFGRIFCGSACPLGVIQDLVIFKPIKLSKSLRTGLGVIPFIYLALALLFAITNTDFIICKYDPFVGIFRVSAEFGMVILGAVFLISGMFIARPFCRFFCPYGALLKICSLNSRHHLSITPEDCINCNLCKDACPFQAIEYPNEDEIVKKDDKKFRKFIVYALLIPVFIVLGGYVVSLNYKVLSTYHPDVKLAAKIISDSGENNTDDIYVETFLASERTVGELLQDAQIIQNKFKTGSWILGAFIGFVIAVSLLNLFIFRKRKIYEPNKGNCFSCGRCMEYCPVGKPDHPYFEEHPEMRRLG